jgi:acetyl-CoA carboxylase biotin carboxylase subunit
VAVYSECDRAARHVRMADEAVAIGPSPAAESYLRIDALVGAARRADADAVHPGYGFLSENDAFAAACQDAGLVFIGPSPRAIGLMGSKTGARRVARAAGVPIVPGSDEPLGPDVPDARITALADQIGYPVLIKAVAGGGGKGMRAVVAPHELPGAIRAARSEALSAFGDPSIYLERRLIRPRHIEVQLLADAHGTVIPFVERECSIQRRHQKVIEESPSPVVTPPLRQALAAAAARIASAAGYTNAGTVEFLVDEAGAFYFLEVNARLQVEHPVTEVVTGVDLVRWQIRIARGERLTLDPIATLTPAGHAVECRIYAEDPDAGFLPSPGRISYMRPPDGPGIRDDGSVETGSDVPVFYDPLVSKLIAWGADRPEAIARMRRALREYDVRGIRTTVAFFRWLLAQPAFHEARFHTGYLDELLQQRAGDPFEAVDPSLAEVAAIVAAVRASRRSVSPAGSAPAARAQPPSQLPESRLSWTRTARREALRS